MLMLSPGSGFRNSNRGFSENPKEARANHGLSVMIHLILHPV